MTASTPQKRCSSPSFFNNSTIDKVLKLTVAKLILFAFCMGYVLPHSIMGRWESIAISLASTFIVLCHIIHILVIKKLARERAKIIEFVIKSNPSLANQKTISIENICETLEGSIKHLEQQDREINRLGQEMQSFVYSTSHDLRSPLVNFTGFVITMEDAINELVSSLKTCPGCPMEPVQKEYLATTSRCMDMISRNLKRFETIIDGLLRYSRAGKEKIKFERFNPSELTHWIVSNYKKKIEDTDALVLIDQLPTSMFADKDYFQRIMENIISNSFKYRSPDRPLKVRISCTTDDERHEFSVSDNGIGIQSHETSKVFQLFYRENPNIEGEGIGLAMAKKQIEMHGGDININNNPSHGCTVKFTIPILTCDVKKRT